MAQALAWRTGPSGGLGTQSSARASWKAAGRWLRFLETLPNAPATPARLTAAHVKAFRERPDSKIAQRDLGDLRLLFEGELVRSQLTEAAWNAFDVRLSGTRQAGGVPGYSDGELARLMAALRSACLVIRRRLRAGEVLLQRHGTEPEALSMDEQALGAVLAKMAASSGPPRPRLHTSELRPYRRAMASHLFLTREDLVPLMMLMAALAHRNGETIKELPVKHRILEGHAVEVTIVKRRRGVRRWYETVTWEIGPQGRELHYPGGMYLLLLELTARSRARCDSPLALCIWADRQNPDVPEHVAPFQKDLRGPDLKLNGWARDRKLWADPAPGKEPVALDLSFNRIKTSMDVRRTKHLGGHLPSAARSNTMQVLFRHYLSGDPVITAWASEVMAEALDDAEQAAIASHQRTLNAAGGALRVVSGPVSAQTLVEAGLDAETAKLAAAGDLDTGWTGCTDHDHHPVTGEECQITFLDCFHCGNCLVTRAHLPRLLELLDALNARRTVLTEDAWWERYGPAWAAIRRDILTKFTPQERAEAELEKSVDTILELVENPWDEP
ncbi:hypothetical protein [Streptomyces prasinus]|uniref:Integrase n=1 Tax=Streptomyces prasinus TaxID=67345 RepID=A0ABX6ASE7_9ACTN|nr:hypothetical protein [Streptomyces prasinus]QEV04922.1 hypothetical protein CP972_03715 [Streptomyces prasinus]